MTAAHNLMNQDEFRMGFADQDQIAEEDDDENEDLDGSKITLFTHEGGDGEDYKNQLMTLNTVQNTESNNDDFNYSDSNYQYIASSSLGAIIQGGGGSFIGSAQNGITIPNLNTRSSNPQRGATTSGRESATPFNYDENSLMNLSNTPTSVAMLMVRGSNPTQYHNSKERLVSGTKLAQKQNSMVQILEEARKEEEEQDESMIKPPPSAFNRSSLAQDLQQDIWPVGGNKKYNPLEMPLQRQHNPFSPPQWEGNPLPNDNQVLSVKMDTHIRDQIFGRCKTEENEDTQQQFAIEQVQAFENYLQNQSQDLLDGGNTEDEIQLIKKKLDFSRLSSLQNLSQQQLYLNGPNSFLFQTYQSISNKSLHNDTQQFSTCNLLFPQSSSNNLAMNSQSDAPKGQSQNLQSLQSAQRKAVPFEELLIEHMKALSRNNEDQRLCKTYFSRDNGCDTKQTLLDELCDRSSVGTIQQEPGINPPLNNNPVAGQTRPPLQQKGGNPAEKAAFQYHQENSKKTNMNSQRDTQTPTVEIIQQNLMQQFQIDCINIYQNNNQGYPEQTFSFANPPPASRQNSNKVYSQTQNPNLPVQQQPMVTDRNHFLPTTYSKHPVTNKIRCQPLSDTPREPSELMIDETAQSIPGGRMNRMQHQILQNHQQLGGFVFFPQNNQADQQPSNLQVTQSLQSERGDFKMLDVDNGDDHYYLNMLQSEEEENEQVKQKVKLKKKVVQSKQSSRLGSKQRNSQQINKQKTLASTACQSVSAFPNNFMSKTMIISKDKINTAVTSQKQSVVELPHKSDSLALQNQIQFVQKYKQQQLKSKKVKVEKQPQTNCLNSGRSMPTSNQSSAQTSFLTVNAQVKRLVQKTTVKKIQQASSSKDTSTIDEKQMKKLKKKTKSVVRQQQNPGAISAQTVNAVISAPITSAHATQQLQSQPTLTEKFIAEQPQRAMKCSTQRSLSRPKSGFGQESSQTITIQPGAIKFGKKKNSVMVSAPTSSHNSNKENIRPGSSAGVPQLHQTSTLPFKKPGTLVGHQLSNRPEELLQSFEHVKLLNGQDLLKEIFNQQQRLSAKNFQNLFSTIDGSQDIGKRAKTEGDNNALGAQVLKTIDGNEIDPYNMMTTIDSQRQKKRPSLNKNVEIYNDQQNKGGAISQQSSNSQTFLQPSSQSNLMQKMQSPYNSKTMKNKFSSIKSKKSESSSMTTLMTAKGLSSSSSVEQIGSVGQFGMNDEDNNRRYNELIHLLKNTRFVAR